LNILSGEKAAGRLPIYF